MLIVKLIIMKLQQTNPEISPAPQIPEIKPAPPQQVPPVPQQPEVVPVKKDPQPSELPPEVPPKR